MMRKAILVSDAGFLEAGPGGVQICTGEYLDSIEAAGFNVVKCPISRTRTWTERVRHRVDSNPYRSASSRQTISMVLQKVQLECPDVVFLNQVALSPIARHIRGLGGVTPKIVVLSHGAEITDMVYLARVKDSLPLSGALRPTQNIAFGSVLTSEIESRKFCDAVIVLSEYDMAFERWLGTRDVACIPRVIREQPLNWQPEGRRLGFVGTLDHAPNLDGLTQALTALGKLEDNSVRIRVIGGPRRVGTWLADTFPLVDYLGPLDDAEMRCEAETWTAFLHPLFSLSRGCSTKLATAIGWCIPIITTSLGRRGYTWERGGLKECDSPEEFASACVDIFHGRQAKVSRDNVKSVANSSPTLDKSAAILRAVVERLGRSAETREQQVPGI